jgi:hypothetical protein
MADENRNTESFALGVIIAVIIFLLIRREFDKKRCSCGNGDGAVRGDGSSSSAPGGCATCADGCNINKGVQLPSNPGITPGVSMSGWGFRAGGGGGAPRGNAINLLGVGNSYESNAGYSPLN